MMLVERAADCRLHGGLHHVQHISLGREQALRVGLAPDIDPLPRAGERVVLRRRRGIVQENATRRPERQRTGRCPRG